VTRSGAPTPLIGPSELQRVLDEVTLLDVRWQLGRSDGRDQYLSGHIPGAAYVDLGTDLADPPGTGGRHPLPDQHRFEEAMRRCGVRDERPTVVYDAVSATSATRAWWLLRFFGQRDVRVLDGGWQSWLRSGGAVEVGVAHVEAGDFHADPGHLPELDAEGAAALARRGGLLDARAPERYRGDVEPVDPVAGHIPGALNVPTALNLDADSRFAKPGDLAASYTSAGVDLDAPIGVYCGSGVTATHDIFALELLGRPAALYPGSWSEWVADPSRPVDTGT
jgi:thiosulfate/3-mercaptopyruvate sulfurtransferase